MNKHNGTNTTDSWGMPDVKTFARVQTDSDISFAVKHIKRLYNESQRI